MEFTAAAIRRGLPWWGARSLSWSEKQTHEIFPAELATAYRADDQKTLASGKLRQFQEWLVYPDGRKVYADTLKLPWVGEDGKVLGVVGVCRVVAAPAGEKPALDQ